MALSADHPPTRLPTWIIVGASLAICLHFTLVGVNLLAARSGPWGEGGMADPPPFALLVNRVTGPGYLLPLKLTHNYHFQSNHPGAPGVYLEARLKDEAGKVIDTVRLPDLEANASVQQLQLLMVRGLATDDVVPPPQGEEVAVHGGLRKVHYWDMGADRTLKIKTVLPHEVPRGRPVFRPSAWSLVLTRSFARHLLRTRAAASVEMIRHTAEAIPPAVLFESDRGAGAPDELIANFGEFTLPDLVRLRSPVAD